MKELAAALTERIEKLEARGKGEGKKKLVTVLKTVKKDCLPRKRKYEKAKRICGKRNSYSKTDRDTTFMRMKEDQGETKVRTGNGQLKPAYNVPIGTEGGFVGGYDLFPNPGDTLMMKRHLERQQERLGVRPKAVIADAGYGSEENYQYREDNGTVAEVTYGTYRKERTKEGKEDG